MRKYIYLFFVSLILSVSCSDEKAHTLISDVELPVLDNPENNPEWLCLTRPYILKVGDVLEIDAHISYSDPDALTYQWVIDGEVVPEDKENGTFRNHLKWTCDLENNASAALYVWMPTEHVGKPIAQLFEFYIEIDHPYEQGIMIAMDQEGEVVYNFLQHRIGKPFVEHPDAYCSGKPVESWLGLIEFWSNENSHVIGNRFHLDSNPLNCHTIETGLVLDSSISLEQEFMQLPENLVLADACFAGYISYLVDQQRRIYSRKSQKGYFTGRYSSEPLEYKGEVLHISKFAESPYRNGVVIGYDMDHERFLCFNNAYSDLKNKNAGMISELPEGVDLNQFEGEDMAYMRVINPDYANQPFTLFLITRNRTSGQYSASEYKVEFGNGNILEAQCKYHKQPLDYFGDNSIYLVLDSPMYGEGYVYYTDNEDPKKLRFFRRGTTDINNYGIYAEFDAGIVSLDQSKIGRRTKCFTAGFDDRTVRVFDLTYSMSTYTAPNGEENNSLMHEWKNLKGDVLQVNYCYGNIALY